MAPSGTPPAPQLFTGGSQGDQQTAPPAPPPEHGSNALSASSLTSRHQSSQSDAPCPRPNPPGVSVAASSSTTNGSSTRSEQLTTAGAFATGAGREQMSQGLTSGSSSLVACTAERWDSLPLLQEFVARIPMVIENERTRPPVVLGDEADRVLAYAKFEAFFTRDTGAQVATGLYSRYLEDIGVARFPITIGKTTLFLLSRLPRDTSARQTLEARTALCAETSQSVPLQDLFDGLLATQTELQVAYKTTEADMISSDALITGIVKLSKGMVPPQAPPKPSTALPANSIGYLDAWVAELRTQQHLFRPRPHLNPDLRQLALNVYPLTALSKTSGASIQEREAVLTVNSYIDFMDSTHIDAFPISSATSMLYLLRISNLPSSTRLIEILPSWTPSHPRFRPSRPLETGPMLAAMFSILQLAHSKVWEAWRKANPRAQQLPGLSLDERFSRILFKAAAPEEKVTAPRPVVAPMIPPPALPAAPTHRPAPQPATTLQPNPQPAPTPRATLIPIPTAPPVAKVVTPSTSTEMSRRSSRSRSRSSAPESAKRKVSVALVEGRQEEEREAAVGIGEVEGEGKGRGEGEVTDREDEKGSETSKEQEQEDAMDVDLETQSRVEVQNEVQKEPPLTLLELIAASLPAARPPHLASPEPASSSARRIASVVPTPRPAPPTPAVAAALAFPPTDAQAQPKLPEPVPAPPPSTLAAPSSSHSAPPPPPPPASSPPADSQTSQPQPEAESHESNKTVTTSGSGSMSNRKSTDVVEETEDEDEREESVELEVEREQESPGGGELLERELEQEVESELALEPDGEGEMEDEREQQHGGGEEVQVDDDDEEKEQEEEELPSLSKESRKRPYSHSSFSPSAFSSPPLIPALSPSPPLPTNLPTSADLPPSSSSAPSPAQQTANDNSSVAEEKSKSKRRKLPPGLVVDFGEWLEKRREGREKGE